MKYFLALMLFPTALFADDLTLLEGDVALSHAEVSQMTQRPFVEFYEGGRSRYSVGGSYSYTYANGGTSFGRFNVEQDGRICISYRNGRRRCDRFVHSHGKLVMLTQDGQRFPIRP